jgi:hypothetical protein
VRLTCSHTQFLCCMWGSGAGVCASWPCRTVRAVCCRDTEGIEGDPEPSSCAAGHHCPHDPKCEPCFLRLRGAKPAPRGAVPRQQRAAAQPAAVPAEPGLATAPPLSRLLRVLISTLDFHIARRPGCQLLQLSTVPSVRRAGLEAAGGSKAADKGVDPGQGAGGCLRSRACSDGGWRTYTNASDMLPFVSDWCVQNHHCYCS